MARLFTGLYSARESLMTHAVALNTVADNLANSNTVGFKNERVEFADLIAESMGNLMGTPLAPGNGVRADSISAAHSTQGGIEFTDRDYDVAIEGRGYFVLGQDEGSRRYSRAGNFITDTNGNLMSQSGLNVMGYTNESPDALVPLNVTTATGQAVATTEVRINGNLNSGARRVENIPTAPADFWELNEATTFRAPVRLIDSLGEYHEISLHYFLSTQTTGQIGWQVDAYADGGDVGGTEGVPVRLGTTNISFNGAGQQAEGANAVLNINPAWSNGAMAGAVAINLGKMTGFAGSSSLSGVSTNGNLAGALQALEIRNNGDVVAHLDSGDQAVIGKIALATFPSAQGLKRIGDTDFQETGKSGQVSVAAPGTKGRGTLRGSALENSTTDPANEFISMIRFQRGYQAGSQVISTVSRLLESTIQIA